jgi:hypothetical protein
MVMKHRAKELLMSTSLHLATYCTHVPVQERLRVDLFTERTFRLLLSRPRSFSATATATNGGTA